VQTIEASKPSILDQVVETSEVEVGLIIDY